MVGNLTQLNLFLRNVSYQGAQDFFGSDAIVLSVEDLGHNGLGGPQLDSQVLPVTVDPVNDPVHLAALPQLRVNEDAPDAFSVNATDVDALSGIFTVT